MAVLTLILALLIPVLLDRLSILNEYGEYGADGEYGKQIIPPPEIKPRSAYRAEVTKGKEAISRLKENHLISVSERVLDEVRL
ncbi:MAG: hypothetical protein LBQ62_05125, partial [Candidatus Accumulibacter sp.]|nr:hypothetical protein [Accumulibacter sp.]